MKKFFLFIALILSSLCVRAETLSLEPASCGALWCSSVPNSSGYNLSVYGSTNYQDVGVTVGKPDGTYLNFASLNYRGYSTIWVGTCPVSPHVGTYTLTNIPMNGYGSTTGVAYITATFSCTEVLGGSGRGQSYHQISNLIEGTLTLP